MLLIFFRAIDRQSNGFFHVFTKAGLKGHLVMETVRFSNKIFVISFDFDYF